MGAGFGVEILPPPLNRSKLCEIFKIFAREKHELWCLHPEPPPHMCFYDLSQRFNVFSIIYSHVRFFDPPGMAGFRKNDENHSKQV